MSDIVVRKARNDYVCDCCGHIIKAGTEYLDKCIIIHGTPIKHERYHDECPHMAAEMILFKKIVAADGDLIVSEPNGDKHHIIGIRYSGSAPHAVIKDWDNGISLLWISTIKDWIDEHGERILSKS